MFPELQIISQDLWDAAHAAFEARAAKAAVQGNPRAAHRNRYLLSGLLRCASCGAPYIVSSRTHYACREAGKRACSNRQTIRIDRIEARVFDRLKDRFVTTELQQVFDRELRAELRWIEAAHNPAELPRLQKQLRDATLARDNILRAIETGAPYASLQERADKIEAEIKATMTRITRFEQQKAVHPALPADTETLFRDAVARLTQLLSDRDLVDQAHQHFARMIDRILLTPDPTARDKIKAEIITDLGLLLATAGLAYTLNNTEKSRKITAKLGA